MRRGTGTRLVEESSSARIRQLRVSAGSITWHPQGIHHGPHPNAATNAADKDFTHEIAVMVDTRHPLRATAPAESVEFREYHMSWRADQKR